MIYFNLFAIPMESVLLSACRSLCTHADGFFSLSIIYRAIQASCEPSEREAFEGSKLAFAFLLNFIPISII